MNRRQSRDLDNYITGHYGEDQFVDENDDPIDFANKTKRRLTDIVNIITQTTDSDKFYTSISYKFSNAIVKRLNLCINEIDEFIEQN